MKRGRIVAVKRPTGPTICSPSSYDMRTAKPVFIHTSDSESLANPQCANRMNAMTVSREGTDSIDPSIDLARAMKTLPYSHGCSDGSAIAGCVENLPRISTILL